MESSSSKRVCVSPVEIEKIDVELVCLEKEAPNMKMFLEEQGRNVEEINVLRENLINRLRAAAKQVRSVHDDLRTSVLRGCLENYYDGLVQEMEDVNVLRQEADSAFCDLRDTLQDQYKTLSDKPVADIMPEVE